MRDRAFVTIVSGLPRSGTSMMMRMLEAGGMPVLTDQIRSADTDNPRGYYEFEAVKRTAQDSSWLNRAEGHAVKMVYRLLYDLPDNFDYRVLVMRRDLDEVLASQAKMLRRLGKSDDRISNEQVSRIYRTELSRLDTWLSMQPNIQSLDVDYNRMLVEPASLVVQINGFLGGGLKTEAMTAVVEPSLYRNRHGEHVETGH